MDAVGAGGGWRSRNDTTSISQREVRCFRGMMDQRDGRVQENQCEQATLHVDKFSDQILHKGA